MKIIFNKRGWDPPPRGPIELVGVDFGYPGSPVFTGLSVTIARGAVSAVTGGNGSGKSTLLGLLASVLRPQCGTVSLGGATDVAFAVQRSHVTDSFPITTAEAVMMGRWRRLGLLRRPSRGDREIVDRWLTELSLDSLRDRTLGELSGGQRQRVLLAQAFAQQSSVLLLDEPTAGLDTAAIDVVITHLRHIVEAGTTVVAATHDAAVVRAADHCVALSGDGAEPTDRIRDCPGNHRTARTPQAPAAQRGTVPWSP